MNFEIHITVNVDLSSADKTYLEILGSCHKWHTSNITDDPILGPGNKFYFTTHSTDYLTAINKMNSMVDALIEKNFKPIRKKIELIMFDERT